MNDAAAPSSVFVRRAGAISAALLAVVVGYYSLVPAGEAPAPQLSDKLRHFVAYASLCVPVALWFGRGRTAAAIAFAALYGAGLEVAQVFADTGREGSVADALANALGACAGGLGVWLARRAWRR